MKSCIVKICNACVRVRSRVADLVIGTETNLEYLMNYQPSDGQKEKIKERESRGLERCNVRTP